MLHRVDVLVDVLFVRELAHWGRSILTVDMTGFSICDAPSQARLVNVWYV